MNWQKFLNLVKRTGDRLIVTDREEGEAYVIMSLSEYENIVARLGARAVDKPEMGHLPEEEGLGQEFSSETPDVPYIEPNFDDEGLSEEERFYLEPVE